MVLGGGGGGSLKIDCVKDSSLTGGPGGASPNMLDNDMFDGRATVNLVLCLQKVHPSEAAGGNFVHEKVVVEALATLAGSVVDLAAASVDLSPMAACQALDGGKDDTAVEVAGAEAQSKTPNVDDDVVTEVEEEDENQAARTYAEGVRGRDRSEKHPDDGQAGQPAAIAAGADDAAAGPIGATALVEDKTEAAVAAGLDVVVVAAAARNVEEEDASASANASGNGYGYGNDGGEVAIDDDEDGDEAAPGLRSKKKKNIFPNSRTSPPRRNPTDTQKRTAGSGGLVTLCLLQGGSPACQPIAGRAVGLAGWLTAGAVGKGDQGHA
ncbi:hypothetical protein AA313_de0205696 [Arthrobotrys entomopaga]|nr:hypothetical protein AA313_de0205696 [Arthrobotrys entomopaga]